MQRCRDIWNLRNRFAQLLRCALTFPNRAHTKSKRAESLLKTKIATMHCQLTISTFAIWVHAITPVH